MTNDLQRHNRSIATELGSMAGAVIESGWYVLGRHVKEFERDFADYCQTENCVTVANGTDALELALRALEVGKGDRVVTVANAGAYSTMAILAVGAIPDYAEIEPESMLMSVEQLRNSICAQTRAIVVTHLYGNAAAVDAVLTLAGEHGIPVVEDCAQAHGAMQHGRRVGSNGALGCYSFYPTKNLGALGDGGAVVTNDPALATRVRQLRQYGWSSKYEIALSGGRNSRMDELQAAILQVKLPRLDEWNQRRFQICESYVAGIRHPMVRLPSIIEGTFVGHLFVVRARRREDLRNHLRRCRIMADVHYPIPDYRQPAIAKLFPQVSLPATERACSEVLSLPCFPEMSDSEVRSVIDAVNEWPAT